MRLKGNELIKRNVFSCYSSTFFSFHVFSGHNARAGIRTATDDVLCEVNSGHIKAGLLLPLTWVDICCRL